MSISLYVVFFIRGALFCAFFYISKRNLTFFFAEFYGYADMFFGFLWERTTNVSTFIVCGNISYGVILSTS